MLGNMLTGDQQAMCPPCTARLGLEMAKALLAPAELAGALGIQAVETPPAKGDGDAGGRKSVKGTAKESKPDARPETPAPLAPGSTATEDG